MFFMELATKINIILIGLVEVSLADVMYSDLTLYLNSSRSELAKTGNGTTGTGSSR